MFFRPVRSVNKPVAQARCSGLILINKRVSGQVSLAFTACACRLWAGRAFGGPPVAVTWAYVAGRLVAARGDRVVGVAGKCVSVQGLGEPG